MNKVITIEEIWSKTKKNFTYGKDYIESETEEYVVICPFNYYVLSCMEDFLRNYGKFHFQHCVCQSVGAFLYWYKGLYQDGRIKTFFIRKDIDISKPIYENALSPLDEFTGWIDFNDRNFLHFTHDCYNRLLTGEYHNYQFDYAYNRTVTKGCKRNVNKVNTITAQVYDDIFRQYDEHINELEETLHNIIDEYE
jgi:hypothetical protein